MKDYLEGFFREIEFPEEAITSLLSDYDKICAHSHPYEVFLSKLADYESDLPGSFKPELPDLRELSDECGISRFSYEFLIYCSMSRHLRELYRINGYSDALWHDAMLDLRYKLYECKALHGVWGSFVCFWFDRFFNMTRFALGRLQFETDVFEGHEVWTHGDITLVPKESKVVSVHIPSSGPLKHDEVLKSYALAHDFYRSYFNNAPVTVFQCHSWILYPTLMKYLPETSNLLSFYGDFEIVYSKSHEENWDCWRLYGKTYVDYGCDPHNLPRTNSLYRGFADCLIDGNLPGDGFGVVLYDGKRVISHD